MIRRAVSCSICGGTLLFFCPFTFRKFIVYVCHGKCAGQYFPASLKFHQKALRRDLVFVFVFAALKFPNFCLKCRPAWKNMRFWLFLVLIVMLRSSAYQPHFENVLFSIQFETVCLPRRRLLDEHTRRCRKRPKDTVSLALRGGSTSM